MKIHQTAIVSPNAVIGATSTIGPYSIIYDNVVIGENVVIGAYCEIGVPTDLDNASPLRIGDNSLIRSHSVFYESSAFGHSLVTGHRVTVRENTVAGVNFQIGTLTEIQGDCIIGNYVRFQSNIFVGKLTNIEDFVWVLPYVIFTNDPTPPSNDLIGCTVKKFSIISAGSTILPGIVVGQGALVAANSCVTKNIPDGKLVVGNPAKIVKDVSEVTLRDGSNLPAYPWTNHFSRGYPPGIFDKLK
jgi:acetyltransferase-like isoleucine patch superfamily enzyme